MTEKAKEIILPHVRQLIKCITKLEPGDEKFSHHEHHIFSSIWNNKFITVDRYAVKKSVDGIIKKFLIHSRLEEAEKLKELVDKFLSSKDFENSPQYDIQWYLLSLLLHLSHNPTSATCTESETIQVDSSEKEEEFDWPAYLLEGQPDVTYLYGGSETEDECYSSDELQEEYSIRSEENFEHVKEELTKKQQGESHHTICVENVTTKGILRSYIEERANAAEKWLQENVQKPLVEGYRANSKYASANLAEFWDAQLKGKTDNTLPTQLLSEYRVLREVLWALQAPPSFSSHPQDDLKGLFLSDGKGGYQVQPLVTIPSLTKGSLQSYLHWLGRHVSLVKGIENFIDEVFLNQEVVVGEASEECLPPHTYEAYASALKEFLSSFKEQVHIVEKKVKSQESTCTLLSVTRELEPMLKELRLVHGIHQKSICNWKQNSNWYCACRLLTMLYGPLLSSLTDVSASVCFKIFLKTFQPYLNIIHVWLTEGRLEDWRGEFIITKNETYCGNVDTFWNEGFMLHPYEDALLEEGGIGKDLASGFPLGLFHLIEEKVLLLGKNMELLQHLDRLSEVQKVSPPFDGTLHDKLKNVLESNLQTYVTEEDKEEIMSLNDPESCDCSSLSPDSLSQTLTLSLQHSNDYYLKKTFEDIFLLPDGSSHSPSKEMLSQHKSKNSSSKQSAVPVLLPIKPMIEHHLLKLLDEHHNISSTIVRSVLLGEYALTSHLLIVRRIFLMEAGDLIHYFCTHLFKQAEMGEMWMDSLSLTNHLQECISARYPDSASLFSISLAMTNESSVPANSTSSFASSASGDTWLNQVDRIFVNYAVEGPIKIVLNSASMESYNTVFQFLLKVRWALWSLQQLRFSDLTGSKVGKVPVDMMAENELDTMPLSAKIHRLQLLRAWLLHFVGSVHSYLMGRVLHGLGMKLEADLQSAHDLDAIIHVHEKYLETVFCQCLQLKTADIFKTAIIRVLDISMTLSTLWKQPSQLTSGRLCEMENQYIRCHVFLANVLTGAVQQGFLQHMETLSTALVHSFPSH